MSDWDAARDLAVMLRLERLTPSAARLRADRWLIPVLVVLGVVSITTRLLARLQPRPDHELRVVGDGAVLALLVVGVVWLYATGRIDLAGTTSPWSVLSKRDRLGVRRQLFRKAPLDLEHADVVLELAHRHRRMTFGFLDFVAIELPNVAGSAIDSDDPLAVGISLAGLTCLLAAGAYGLITCLRVAPLIRRLDH